MQFICYYLFAFFPVNFLLLATHELKISYFYSGCQVFKLCFIYLKTMLCFFFYIHHPCNKDCGTRAGGAFISGYISSAVVKSPSPFLSGLSALLNHLLVQRKMKSGFWFRVALGWREQEEDEAYLALPYICFYGSATFPGARLKTGLETLSFSNYVLTLFNLMGCFPVSTQHSTALFSRAAVRHHWHTDILL